MRVVKNFKTWKGECVTAVCGQDKIVDFYKSADDLSRARMVLSVSEEDILKLADAIRAERGCVSIVR